MLDTEIRKQGLRNNDTQLIGALHVRIAIALK